MSAATEDTVVYAVPHELAMDDRPELRVLHVFSNLGMGGAETWLISLLRYFRDHGDDLPVRVQTDVLLTGGDKSLLDDEAKELGARLFYLPFGRRNLIGFVKEFRRILAEGNYDAIHDHQDYIAGLHFFLGAGRLPSARIAHVHNPHYHRHNGSTGVVKRTVNSAGKTLIMRLATHVTGTSKQIIGEYGFHETSGSRVQLDAAHCGFDVNKYRGDRVEAHRDLCREMGWPEAARIILFIGRLDGAEMDHRGLRMTHKNPAFALDVARECVARDTKTRLLMVGDGAQKKAEFESLVGEWELSDQISLVGVRADVPRLMLGSNVLLFPSLAEGLGMVVVEAQAAGLRVLASDTTPRECVIIPELVKFSSLESTAAQWASDLLELMDSEDPDVNECNSMVRESAFSIENSAAKLLSLYGNSRWN